MSPLAAKPAPASISAEPGTSQAGGRSTASPSEVHTGVHTRVSTKPHAATVLPAGVQPSPARTAEVRHGTVPDQDPGPQVPDQGAAGLPPLPCRPGHRARPAPWPSGHRAPRWRAITAGSAMERHLPRARYHATAPQRRSPAHLEQPPVRTQRLLADTCELCGSGNQVEVHHIRGLKDLNPRGRAHQPEWATRMAARRRKTLVVCRVCTRTSMPDVPHGEHDEHWRAGCHGNRARPVRRGAVGKGPGQLAPRRRPTLPQALFGKRRTEKDPAKGTSPAVDLT